MSQEPKYDRLTDICNHLAYGMTRKAACALEDVCTSTLRKWILDEKEWGEGSRYFGTMGKVERAEGQFLQAATMSVMAGIKDDPHLALKVLERRSPAEWSASRKITGADGGPVQVDVSASVRVADDLLARIGATPHE